MKPLSLDKHLNLPVLSRHLRLGFGQHIKSLKKTVNGRRKSDRKHALSQSPLLYFEKGAASQFQINPS